MFNQNITSTFSNASQIIIYKNNTATSFYKGDDKYEIIMLELKNMTQNSQQMPALGVALDTETRTALKNGIWIELIFNSTHSFNEMPFDSLLFEVVCNNSGMNIIRKQNGKYEGRCFYLNLQENMSNFLQIIENISKNN